MPATHPPLAPPAIDSLNTIGATLRARRKAMKVSAVAASEAAGISRVTLHRIEKGEPS
ncbi:MAG: helix-turn-helix domain-containing protein, partial [Ramlibacter sp.]|nr:helix-turn-helix domain-containing protein [Ramlibacter sp.]